MDIWAGDIDNVPDRITLSDVHLQSSNLPSPTLAASSLSYLSLVNTSQIPLHLIAGPQLEVRTGDVDTEEWLASALSEEIADTDNPDDISTRSSSVASRSWWESPFAQCAAGVLLKVNKKEDVPRCDGNASRITEILIYGARILDQKRCESMLPSPPPSSPSKQLRQTQETETIAEDLRACSEQPLDIFALPLSSDLLYLPVDHTTPPLSPHNTSPTEENREVTCTFLQRTLGQSSTVITNDNKRQRVTNLFDKASQRRLKARRVGSSDLTSLKICEAFHKRGRKPISFDGRSESFEGDLHESADQPSRLRRTLSSHSTFIPPDAACRISHVANYKRSSLSRTSSISNLPSPASFECEELVTRNKNFISRVVMAGLRLNGLQPTKTSSRLRRQSTVGSETIADGGNTTKKVKVDSSSDEPFKATYHMVFKATVHTFRDHLNSKQLHLHPEALRDTVEKILAIFSNDPLLGICETDQPKHASNLLDGNSDAMENNLPQQLK